MIPSQRYVSRELSHFVGKGMRENGQYDLLVNKILKTGWLTHPPHDPAQPRGVNFDLSKPISTDEAIKSQVVCFCDIPDTDLAIHVGKYSKFGLAFEKNFLVTQGASPVAYVANESPVPVASLFVPDDFRTRVDTASAKGVADRALYYDTSVRAIVDILAAFDALANDDAERYIKGIAVSECKSRLKALFGLSDAQISALEAALKGNRQAIGSLRTCSDFLLNYVFSFVKSFDSCRPFEDELHYYMEREWRVAGNVKFTLGDVSRVFFPPAYAKRFRTDLPDYLGQISFVD